MRNRTLRSMAVTAAAVAAMAVLPLAAGPADAQPSGPGPGNSPNAKACQKGGWENLATSDGDVFSSEEECVSHAARGGVLQEAPAAPTPTFDDWRTACEKISGGAIDLDGLTWRCDSVDPISEAALAEFEGICSAAAGGFVKQPHHAFCHFD